jgi:aminoglycoside 2'-N-acetyltransferase I
VPQTRTIHTADLTTAELSAIRGLLDLAFAGGFDDHDFDHALGGLHVLVVERGEPIAHGAVVQRQFWHADRSWRCGYVEAVAVHPSRRGQGHAATVLTELERIIDHGYDLGALSTSEDGRGLYLRRGWLPWSGPTCVLAPGGLARTEEDDDGTFVRMVAGGAELDLTGTLTCDWREGDVW